MKHIGVGISDPSGLDHSVVMYKPLINLYNSVLSTSSFLSPALCYSEFSSVKYCVYVYYYIVRII